VRIRSLIAGAGALAAFLAVPSAALAQPFNPRPRETAALAHAKQRANSVLPQASQRRATAPRTQLFSGTVSFDGAQAIENQQWAGYTPPDPTGSAGPDHYVEIVNSMIESFDKSGTPETMSGQTDPGPVDLQTFFNAEGPVVLQTPVLSDPHNHPGDSVFDVQVQWDSASGRWVIASADELEPADSTHPGLAALVYGWSKTADPTGEWCIYRTNPDTPFEDYPKLGHDGSHMLIGTNEFHDSSEASGFVGAKLWKVSTPTSDIGGVCPPAPGLTEHDLNGFTPVPVNIADGGPTTTGYVVATTGAGTSSSLLLYTLDSSGDVADTSVVPVNSFTAPPNVQQPGTADVLDSADGRLTQAVATGNDIWTQHTVRSADGQRAQVRWYELDGSAGTKLQEGAIGDLSNSVFNAAISPTADGHDAAIQYNVGGRFHLVTLRAQTRRDTVDQLGRMENELTIASSPAIDQDFSCADGPSCRWGDYSGASPDPSNTDVVWGTNQYNGTIQPDNNPSWLTRNFAVQFGGTDPAPIATVDGFPFTSSSPTPAFNFASSETGSTFQCSLNGGAFAACTPGKLFGPALGNSSYTFAVIATDSAGQQSPPVQGSFTVAAPLPDTAIDSGPPASGTSRSASFSFHSTKPGSSFRCSFDGSAFAACASPFTKTHLSPAQHAFAVYAVDAQGNADPSPAASSFKVSLAQGGATIRAQRISGKGTVSIRISCPAAREQACTGTITLTSGKKLGVARFRVSAGHKATIHVKLTKSGRKRVQSKKRLKMKATVRFNSPAKRTSKTVILRKR
jgi:hypothetical protein